VPQLLEGKAASQRFYSIVFIKCACIQLQIMVAHPCPFLRNYVDTESAENTEMSVSQDLRKRIVALHEKGATGYIVAKQFMLS
jgi:hypothetical protein